MPRIALDARLTRQMSVGMKTYARELVARLPVQAPDLEFVIASNEPLATPAPNAKLWPLRESLAANGSLGEQLFLWREFARGGADLVHYMSVYAPRFSAPAHVYTIHDLIHLRFPEYFSWKVSPYYRLVVGPVARSAKAVITDARATVGDIVAYLGVAAANIRVVPLGVNEAFWLEPAAREAGAENARRRFALERPYFIYAGNHRPHKNVATLVAAWRTLAQSCDLVLTEEGPFGFDLDRGPKHGGRMLATGRVTQDELISLYAGCAAAVAPSLYEGFGLSVLESMACGAPVIVAQTPALLELGGTAVLTFPPKDESALATAMTAILSDPEVAQRLSNSGRERARTLSWDVTARATVGVYREALKT